MNPSYFTLRTVRQTLTESLGAGILTPEHYRRVCAGVRSGGLQCPCTEAEFLAFVSSLKG